jgi:hypothetical protein
MLQSLMELPGTQGMGDLRARADALSAWKLALQRGCDLRVACSPPNALQTSDLGALDVCRVYDSLSCWLLVFVMLQDAAQVGHPGLAT